LTAEQDLVAKLATCITADRRRLLKYDHYHEGLQPLKYMAPALEAELGDRVAQLVINWPRMITEAHENRKDITGFRWTDSQKKSWDNELWELFTVNSGTVRTQQLFLEKLICGRSYVIVGSGTSSDDPPVFTEEHPLQMTVERDARTREITAALKLWVDADDVRARWAQLYLPDSTILFRNVGRGWTQKGRDDHNLGVVLVEEFLNRGRMLRQLGVSGFHDAIPLADAANKMATDMMISGEFHAMPRRWALGFSQSDFEDDAGNPVDAWSVLAGKIWSSAKGPKEAEVGQFTQTDLSNFHQTLKLLAQLAGQLTFLPDDYTSFATENPPSADSVKAKESRFIKQIERGNSIDGAGMARVQGLMLRVMGVEDPKMRSIETLWRDPSTPTLAQVADAHVKLVAAGIEPIEFAREQMGYTLEDRQRMKDMDTASAAANPLGQLANQFRTQQQPAPANAGA
jgi:hypothetical protein